VVKLRPDNLISYYKFLFDSRLLPLLGHLEKDQNIYLSKHPKYHKNNRQVRKRLYHNLGLKGDFRQYNHQEKMLLRFWFVGRLVRM
jgi:hypothetical protein